MQPPDGDTNPHCLMQTYMYFVHQFPHNSLYKPIVLQPIVLLYYRCTDLEDRCHIVVVIPADYNHCSLADYNHCSLAEAKCN